jgi:hypothetical protein
MPLSFETKLELKTTGDTNPHARNYVSCKRYLTTDNKMGSELKIIIKIVMNM